MFYTDKLPFFLEAVSTVVPNMAVDLCGNVLYSADFASGVYGTIPCTIG